MQKKKVILFLSIILSITMLSACKPVGPSATQTLSPSPAATVETNRNSQPKIKRLFAIGDRSYAVIEDGSLWQWGGDSEKNAIFYPEKLEFPAEVMKLVGEDAHFALLSDGTLWSWGKNFQDGWLGDGSIQERSKPLQILENVKDFCMTKNGINSDESESLQKQGIYIYFTYSVFALKNDGTLWAWGRNTEGELGDSTYISKLDPIKIMDQVDEIFSSDKTIGIKKTDGSLWTIKRNTGSETAPRPNTWEKQIDTVEKAAVYGSSRIAYINAQGELYQFIAKGTEKYHKKLLSDVTDVQCYGAGYYVALQKNGTLWKLGFRNSNGTLDKTIEEPKTVTSNISKILCSDADKLCVLTLDKKVLSTTLQDDTLRVIAEDVAQLASSNFHFLMVSAKDGKLYGWGSCVYGQLGVDLNQGEMEIELPVEILIPTDWNKMN